MDIKQDYVTGKIIFANGELFPTSNRQDSLRQRLSIRLKTQKGTWFLNVSFGIDWFNDVFSDTATKASTDAIIKAEILKESLVERILEFKSSVNQNREYSCSFKVKIVDDTTSETIKLLINENGLLVVTDDNITIRVM